MTPGAGDHPALFSCCRPGAFSPISAPQHRPQRRRFRGADAADIFAIFLTPLPLLNNRIKNPRHPAADRTAPPGAGPGWRQGDPRPEITPRIRASILRIWSGPLRSIRILITGQRVSWLFFFCTSPRRWILSPISPSREPFARLASVVFPGKVSPSSPHTFHTDPAPRWHKKNPGSLTPPGFLSWSKWRDSNPRPFGPAPVSEIMMKNRRTYTKTMCKMCKRCKPEKLFLLYGSGPILYTFYLLSVRNNYNV